jgi:hypothetical protein
VCDALARYLTASTASLDMEGAAVCPRRSSADEPEADVAIPGAPASLEEEYAEVPGYCQDAGSNGGSCETRWLLAHLQDQLVDASTIWFLTSSLAWWVIIGVLIRIYRASDPETSETCANRPTRR